MGHPSRRYCKCCGKDCKGTSELSWQGYCRECGLALLQENVDGIAAGKGFAHRRWLRGYERMLEKSRLDAPLPRP